ncbi:phospholipid carrier-dependent glycosyltransferase [Clostridium botulinum]|nr:phospholipid carrier-dependent glycosyltransferase [Clostridium botulinum]
MNKLDNVFTTVMNTMLKIILSIIIIASICILFPILIDSNVGTIVFLLVIIISMLFGYKIINSNISYKQKIFSLILISIFIKILWILNADNTPNSDFKVMYECGKNFISGDLSCFKGIGYIGRFPHLTIHVLYMAAIQYLSPASNLLIMKIISLFLGTTVVLIVYLITLELFKSKEKALLSLLIASVFPPFITYTSVFCSENLAMPFYLLSIYLFLRGIESDKYKFRLFCLSSICLALGNLFRMVAIIVLIAYTLYILIYYKDRIFKKLINIVFVVVPYFLIIVLVSSILQKINITENPLWRGSEPKITNVLKGTNFNSLGMWNVEDAKLVEENINNYDELKLKCKEVIHDRFTTAPIIKVLIFYLGKLGAQWCIGDFAGSLWTQKDVPKEKIIFKIGIFGSAPFQIFYIIILIFIFLGLKKRSVMNSNSQLNLFYLIFLGYIAAYLITENQNRYGYIISWLFIILAVDGIKDGFLFKAKDE